MADAPHCAECDQPSDRFRVLEGRLLCRPCRQKLSRQKRRDKGPNHYHRSEDTFHRLGQPEEIAKKLEAMRRGRMAYYERRKQEKALAAVALTPGTTYVKEHIGRRRYEVMLAHLAGLTAIEIAQQLGYSGHSQIKRILNLPVVKNRLREIDLAREKQIMEGKYGVRAQAKVAAPGAMKQIVADGQTAPKAGDRATNNKLVLQVSGDLVDRRETHKFQHIIADLSNEELLEVKLRGVWPARYREIMDKLGMNGPPAIDVTPEE